jgi:hypothetical protein
LAKIDFMNFTAIAAATVLGLSAPTITDISLNSHAIAAPKFQYPTGSFSNSEWSVLLTYNNNAYSYKGTFIPKNTSINLVGATASGDHQRQIYTWRNNGLKYQVTWRPSDRDTIRVQVVKPNGTLVLNTLLTRNIP